MSKHTAEIERLAGIHHDKKQRFICLGSMNSYGRTAEESRAQSITYELARGEMFQALKDLRAAQDEG